MAPISLSQDGHSVILPVFIVAAGSHLGTAVKIKEMSVAFTVASKGSFSWAGNNALSISPAICYPALSTNSPSKLGTRPPHHCCFYSRQANCMLMLLGETLRAVLRVAPLRCIRGTFGRGPCLPTASWRSNLAPWSRVQDSALRPAAAA